MKTHMMYIHNYLTNDEEEPILLSLGQNNTWAGHMHLLIEMDWRQFGLRPSIRMTPVSIINPMFFILGQSNG